MGFLSFIFKDTPKQAPLKFRSEVPFDGGHHDGSHQRYLVAKQLAAGKDLWTLEFTIREPDHRNNYDRGWKFDGYPEGGHNRMFTAAQALAVADHYFKSLPQPSRYGGGALRSGLMQARHEFSNALSPSVPNAHPA